MRYETLEVVGGGTFTQGIAETDEDREFILAEVKAGRATIGDGWSRKDRERVAREMKAEEEARKKQEAEQK